MNKTGKDEKYLELQVGLFMENVLLQSYRIIFLLAEGILLGIGALFFESPIFWPFCVIGITTIIFWMVTCSRRSKIVSWWSEKAGKNPRLAELYEYEDTMPSLGLTRFLNIDLPVILGLIWIMLGICSIL